MILRSKQYRPKVLNDVKRLAVEFEAYDKAESKTPKSTGNFRQTTSDKRTETPNRPPYGCICATNDGMNADD